MGVYLVLGLYLVLGGVPGPGGAPGTRGVHLVRGCTWSWGVYLVLGGAPGTRGVYLVRGCTWLGVPAQVLPPVNRMTDRCKNITFATSLRTVIISTHISTYVQGYNVISY